MSVATARSVGACLATTFGLTFIIMGSILVFIMSPSDSLFSLIFNIMLYGGILLFIVGVVLIPSVKKETSKVQSIIEIAAVRKEVTISEISQETGLDSEYVRKVLTQYLVRGFLFGYIEGDLFVRDTGGRSRPVYRGQAGLFTVDE